jgi:hypothetical protein
VGEYSLKPASASSSWLAAEGERKIERGALILRVERARLLRGDRLVLTLALCMF